MASSSHVLFVCACLVTLASLCASQTCPGSIPTNCSCNNKVIMCHGLDKFPPHTDLGTFESFVFTRCNFETVGPDNFPDYPSAKSLMLDNCQIKTFLTSSFISVSTLEELTITNNFIKNITKDVLYLPTLIHLTLDENELSSLSSDVFESLTALKSIHINNNLLSSLPENVFSKNPLLSDVELEFNKFEEIPTAALIKVKDTLNRLVLAGNKNIGPLKADMFKDFPNLDYLDVSVCDLTAVDVNTFRGLPKLKTILLDYNLLKELPKDVFTPVRSTLKKVWLLHNQLTTLENGTLPLHTLTELYLGHNPWHCDKKIAWFKDLNVDQTIDHENVTCATPESLAGQLLSNVTRDVLNKQPGPSSSRSMIAAAIAIPIIVLCVLAILCIVLRLVQNRRQQKRAQVRYSAVYRDTVESAPKGHHHRPTSNI